jgi:murein DD-endopeptidase MepM/ murein hydrolase activator NlpD
LKSQNGKGLPLSSRWAKFVVISIAVISLGYGVADVLTSGGADKGESLTGEVASAEIDAANMPVANVSWPQIDKRSVKVRRGDTLSEVIARAGADKDTSFQIVTALKKNFSPRSLQSGKEIEFTLERSGPYQKIAAVTEMSMTSEIDSRLVVRRNEDGSYKAKIESTPVHHVAMHAGGVISDSLFLSAQRQGVPASVTAQLIRIFSYDVDFQRGIKEGDHFELYFDRTVSADGTRTREGDILYARLTLAGSPITLFRYADNDGGNVDYFHENGESIRKALMKTPIDGARLSSGYGMRWHPILGYTKMHKGVDFAAPRGTPVMAAGDGVVEKASTFGTYGNYIKIRHKNNYSTAYAHLSGYATGLRAGARVRQGQIIGYVGTTGRSTGPHLHYEVLLANRQTDPRGLKIPTGTRLAGKAMVAFKSYMRGMEREVASVPTGVMLARN